MGLDCFYRDHGYEPIAGDRRGDERLRARANSSSKQGSRLSMLRRCGAVFCAVGLWVSVRSYLPQRDGAALGDQGEAKEKGLLMELGQSGGRGAPRGDDNLMQVLVTNKYQRADETSTRMYPWQHLAEPARDTRLEILSWPGRNAGAALEFRWKVDDGVIGIGDTISTVFHSPGQYQCSVSSYSRAGKSKEADDEGREAASGEGSSETTEQNEELSATTPQRHSGANANPSAVTTAKASTTGSSSQETTMDFVVVVKYVRREIRTLTDRDREVFFNAMSIMQRVPSAIGRAVYGTNYYSKDYFNRMHLYYGGRRDCDHWHNGAGFVTSHIALSLMYEQSLQAINPSIALPYWDFTVEGTFYDWSNFRSSSIFSDDWFGSAAPKNALRTPSRGRFGYLPTMMDATEYSDLCNSYGMLRSPWNNDPTPFLTRSDHLVGFRNHRKPSGCRRYRDAMMQRTWMALTESFNAGAHGGIHQLLGGSWSQQVSAYAERTDPIVQPFVHVAVPYLKMLWRSEYIVCPDTCATDVPWETCTCKCSEAAFAGQKPSEVLQDAGILASGFFYDKDFVLIESLADEEGNAYDVIPGYTKEETEDIYNEMLQVLCMPMRHGSHYGATSTNDPTFWLIHPTFDRLWHLRRLEANDDFVEDWIPDHSCSGHNPDDVTPFHDLFLGDDGSPLVGEDDNMREVQRPKSYYTNSKLYTMLDPFQMQSPYSYDNFEWPHCDAQGVFIHGVE